jgi:hypothetical protein
MFIIDKGYNKDYDGTHCEKYKRKIGEQPSEA